MTDPTNSFNSYQHWRDHVRATIYATALANLCTAHLAKGEEVTPAVLEEERKKDCTVRDGKFLEPCTTLLECVRGINPTKRHGAGVYLFEWTHIPTHTPTRTFAVLKSGDHVAKGIVMNVCPFCGTRIDEMVAATEADDDDE